MYILHYKGHGPIWWDKRFITYDMEKHVTNGQQKSSKAKRKRSRVWKSSLVLWGCHLTQKFKISDFKIFAHLLIFLHCELGPNKVAPDKKGVGEELKNIWRGSKCRLLLQWYINSKWITLLKFNWFWPRRIFPESYLIRWKAGWLCPLPLSIIDIPR